MKELVPIYPGWDANPLHHLDLWERKVNWRTKLGTRRTWTETPDRSLMSGRRHGGKCRWTKDYWKSWQANPTCQTHSVMKKSRNRNKNKTKIKKKYQGLEITCNKDTEHILWGEHVSEETLNTMNVIIAVFYLTSICIINILSTRMMYLSTKKKKTLNPCSFAYIA